MVNVDNIAISKNHNVSSFGNQTKFQIGDRWYKIDDVGYEGLSEVVVSNLLKKSNVESFVIYRQEQFKYKGKSVLGCSSENFRPENAKIVTADQIFRAIYGFSFHELNKEKNTENTILSFVEKLSKATDISTDTIGTYLTQILELDAFTLNNDRHLNNIAFIMQDNIFVPAPIFDNGAAFLSTEEKDTEKEIDEIIPKIYAKPFSIYFSEQKEAAETLFGHQLEFMDFYSEELVSRNCPYDEKIIERVLDVLDFQKKRYPELIIGTLEYNLEKAKDKCRKEKENCRWKEMEKGLER